MERGLDISEDVLVIVDGGKGFQQRQYKRAFGNRALVQRCQWERTRERGELPVEDRASRRGASGFSVRTSARSTTKPGRPSNRSMDELVERNQSAAASLEDGLEETLTLHRLGVYGVLGRTCNEDELLGIGQCPRRGKARRRTIICEELRASGRAGWRRSLMDIEPGLRKAIGYRHLPRSSAKPSGGS